MFKLMLVTDRRRSKLPLTETVRLALEGGVDAVQLRERDIADRELYGLAEELRRITQDADAALVISQRVDIALATGADGVHLGWRSMRVKDVGKLAGERLQVGVSCHNLAQFRSVEAAGADYVLLGPVFDTRAGRGPAETLGLEGLQDLVANARVPVIAIGGINAENVAAVRDAGVAGVAVISAIIASDDPRTAAERLLSPL